jgi:hypothetical protein
VLEFLNNLWGARNRRIGLSHRPARARICKQLWSPGIDSEESISPAYVAWRASTTNRVAYTCPGNRFLGSLKGLQIRAQATQPGRIGSLEPIHGLLKSLKIRDLKCNQVQLLFQDFHTAAGVPWCPSCCCCCSCSQMHLMHLIAIFARRDLPTAQGDGREGFCVAPPLPPPTPEVHRILVRTGYPLPPTPSPSSIQGKIERGGEPGRGGREENNNRKLNPRMKNACLLFREIFAEKMNIITNIVEKYPVLQISAHKLTRNFCYFCKINFAPMRWRKFRSCSIIRHLCFYLSVPDVHADAASAGSGGGGGGLMVGGWRRAGRHQGRQLRTHQVRQVGQVARVHLRHQL